MRLVLAAANGGTEPEAEAPNASGPYRTFMTFASNGRFEPN